MERFFTCCFSELFGDIGKYYVHENHQHHQKSYVFKDFLKILGLFQNKILSKQIIPFHSLS